MKETADLTVILTVWKRNHLDEQIQCLLKQTVRIANIWLLQCGDYVQVEEILARYPAITYVHSGIDLKYFGRFSLALHASSLYKVCYSPKLGPLAKLENSD